MNTDGDHLPLGAYPSSLQTTSEFFCVQLILLSATGCHLPDRKTSTRPYLVLVRRRSPDSGPSNKEIITLYVP